MNDYINRQVAIDEIDSLYFDTVDDHDRAKERIKRLPSAEPEPQWIPCSERLPEEMTYVLVTDKDGDVYSVKFIEVIDGQAEWVFDNGILAWMPLPEPYAERRTDEI